MDAWIGCPTDADEDEDEDDRALPCPRVREYTPSAPGSLIL